MMDLSDQQEVYQHYLEKLHQIIMMTFIVSVVYDHIEQIMHLKSMKGYVINIIIANQ